MMRKLLTPVLIFCTTILFAQTDQRMYDIINAVSSERIEKDVTTLVGFGTRHTLSDTVSKTRGIGAARRWIKSEFDKISSTCGNCLEVSYHKDLVKKDENARIVKDVEVVNVVAIQRGTKYPDRYIIMSGDIDSRVSDPTNFTSESPGANDNASGMAGTIEAARVLSKYKFESSIIYLGLSGEEQGLFGGQGLVKSAKEKGWDIIGISKELMELSVIPILGSFLNPYLRPKRKGNAICVVFTEVRLMVSPGNWRDMSIKM